MFGVERGNACLCFYAVKRKRLVAAVHGDDITVTGAADVKWMVNELSEVVEVGRRSVRERGLRGMQMRQSVRWDLSMPSPAPTPRTREGSMDRRLEEEFSRVTFIMHHEERGDAESDQDSDSSELDDVSCLIHLLVHPLGWMHERHPVQCHRAQRPSDTCKCHPRRLRWTIGDKELAAVTSPDCALADSEKRERPRSRCGVADGPVVIVSASRKHQDAEEAQTETNM